MPDIIVDMYQKDTIKCPYKLGDSLEKSPHVHQPLKPAKKIYEDVLDAIGNTPMIRINKLPKEQDIQCEFLAKCEFMNMGGSVKDRIGRRMVLDAEKEGRLKPGDKIVEATSGNTGIGLTLAASVKGYEMVITMPQKMSMEKANVLKALGAKIIRTPTECSYNDPDSHISISNKLRDEQGYVLLDQYSSPSNPLAHFDSLAEQILEQCDGRVDAIVVGVGTGGTIAGISRKIKIKSPSTLMVGADPYGSILAIPGTLNVDAPPNYVEGIGYDFVPRTCARESVDHWIKTADPESFKNSRDLIRKEGLLVGGSAGSVYQAGIQFVKKMGWQKDPSKRVVCVFSDSVRNYITKFVSQQWCIQKGFLDYSLLKDESSPLNGVAIGSLDLPEIKVHKDLSVAEAKELILGGATVIPLGEGKVTHVIWPRKFMELVLLKKLKSTDSALKTRTNEFACVPQDIDVCQLSKFLQRYEAVIVQSGDKFKIAKPIDIIKLQKE